MQKFETRAIREQAEQTHNREHSVPLYLTSSFTFNDAEQARALFAEEEQGNVYSRFTNPNTQEFERKIAILEGTEDAFSTASGMAAVYASMAAFLKTGDHIVSSRSIFGNTHKVFTEVFPAVGISTTYVNITDRNDWEQSIQKNTKLIYVETPSNPSLDVIDLEWLSNLAKSNNALLVVDNCFATPYLQNPAKFGADLVVHSATKYIDGQGRVLGGAIAGTKENISIVKNFVKRTGAALSPFSAWILSKSLETLAVRMDRHCSNAETLASQLKSHPDIETVVYPHFVDYKDYSTAIKQMKQGGGLFCMEVKGGAKRAARFLDALELFSKTANLGDTRSIATHPASTTHSKFSLEDRKQIGVSGSLIRISAGLEHSDDLLEDLLKALHKSK